MNASADSYHCSRTQHACLTIVDAELSSVPGLGVALGRGEYAGDFEFSAGDLGLRGGAVDAGVGEDEGGLGPPAGFEAQLCQALN